jgi:glyoxylase-like metal-dependent hydrolase (beta-lactamase superfamily II)
MMNMSFSERSDNVYVIDTKMFGFDHYQSCYIVAGKEVVLIDAGIPSQLETFRLALKKHGFFIQDISRIFLTHCEHPDHAGNVGVFVAENPKIKVFINPVGLEYLTNPSIENENRKKVMLPQMAARFGEQIPVPRSRIEFLKDGDVVDIGSGEKLRIMFTPAHQPSGLVIVEEKNRGLFINDIVGNYFSDVDVNLILTPQRSDVLRAREDLRKFQKMNIQKLYLGHYGIDDQPRVVFDRALKGIQRILDIAEKSVKEGKPEEIERRVLDSRMLDIENLKKRSLSLFEYTRDELITHHSTYFAKYYLDRMKNNNM